MCKELHDIRILLGIELLGSFLFVSEANTFEREIIILHVVADVLLELVDELRLHRWCCEQLKCRSCA